MDGPGGVVVPVSSDLVAQFRAIVKSIAHIWYNRLWPERRQNCPLARRAGRRFCGVPASGVSDTVESLAAERGQDRQPSGAFSTPAGVARRRSDLMAFLGFSGLASLFYLPILLGLRTFPDGDFTYHFLPFSLYQRSEVLAGRLPVWNPYTYSGHPFLADVQAAVFYPISNLVLGLTLAAGSAGARLYWLEVEAILHIALAGFFTYLLVRGLTGRSMPAFLAGCAFAFSGYLTGYPPLQIAALRTAIWLPLILWLLLRAFAEPARWRWWAGASLAYATAFLAGHSQTFLYVSYVVAAWILLLLVLALAARGVPDKQAGRLRLALLARLAGRIGAFYLLFLVLTAAQMWPSLEFAGLSVRASVDYAFVSGGFPFEDTWQMLLPRILTLFSPLYAGVATVGLALIAIAWCFVPASGQAAETYRAVSSRSRVFIAFFGAMALAALLLSYGDEGRLYAFFYRWLPGWNLFRGQERAAYLVGFGLSVLAGYGAAAVEMMGPRRRRVLGALFGTAVLGGLAAFWLTRGPSSVSAEAFRSAAAVSILFAAGFVVVLCVERLTPLRPVLLVALVVLDLFLAGSATNVSQFGPARKVLLPPEAQASQAAMAPLSGSYSGPPGRAYNEYRVFEDYGMRTGVEDVWGSSPLRLARYDALFKEFPLDRMWRLTGVQNVLTWRRELFGPSQLLAEFPQAKDTTYLHRLSELNPRAWLANAVRTAGDEEALGMLRDHGFDLSATAILPPEAGGNAARLPVDGQPAAAGEARILMERLAPNHLKVQAWSEQGGLLVVSENWMPGWRARVRQSGTAWQDAPVLRADLTLLGIAVPPGETTIDLVYWPDSVRFGFAISAAGVILLGLTVAWRGRRASARRVMARVPSKPEAQRPAAAAQQ